MSGSVDSARVAFRKMDKSFENVETPIKRNIYCINNDVYKWRYIESFHLSKWEEKLTEVSKVKNISVY